MAVNRDKEILENVVLLGNRVVVALIRTPGSYESESLTLVVPTIAREPMNVGVVWGISRDASEHCAKNHGVAVAKGDVVMVKPYKGAQIKGNAVTEFGLDPRRHWMMYEAEDLLAIVDTKFRD